MKQVRTDAKLKNLPEELLEELWRYRYPEEDGEKLSYESILVELKLHHGIETSMGALSEFYAWLGFKRRAESARQRAIQATLEWSQKNPSATSEELDKIGQLIFTSETIENGNVKAFVSLLKASNDQRKIKLDERRIVILEKRAAQADAASVVLADVTTSPEEQQRKLKEIFRIET
jgi:hypothetical protein